MGGPGLARINQLGQVTARCIGCSGALSVFDQNWSGSEGCVIATTEPYGYDTWKHFQYRLFRCVGCGMGALGAVEMQPRESYPDDIKELVYFAPEAGIQLSLPEHVPKGIREEFREAERCLQNSCWRAAAGLFRSVLAKTLRANGYKTSPGSKLHRQIDEAASDGTITKARAQRAHEEIRVLGNDILHDVWRQLSERDVEPAHHYCQRILEDFYDDRASVLALLREAGRRADDMDSEDGQATNAGGGEAEGK